MRSRRTVHLVNAHAEGEVGNVVVGGVVDVPGDTTFEKMEYMRDRDDALRRSLIFEPRGSVCQAVNLLVPPSDPKADLGFVIMEATKYPMMSGSNTMCVATVVLETGIRPMQEPITTLVLESPGGLVEARCQCKEGRVQRVELTMLPSFVLESRLNLDVSGYGKVDVSIAYGGIFYAIASAEALGLSLSSDKAAEIVRAGIAIRQAADKSYVAVHPDNPKVRGIANVIVAGPLSASSSGQKETISATVIGNGRLDRSPCGTGVAARIALLHQAGAVKEGELVLHRSIFGTHFESTIASRGKVGALDAVVAKVSGRAWITGFSQTIVDPTDPVVEGHCPSDVWLTQG
jgi:proline racemase